MFGAKLLKWVLDSSITFLGGTIAQEYQTQFALDEERTIEFTARIRAGPNPDIALKGCEAPPPLGPIGADSYLDPCREWGCSCQGLGYWLPARPHTVPSNPGDGLDLVSADGLTTAEALVTYGALVCKWREAQAFIAVSRATPATNLGPAVSLLTIHRAQIHENVFFDLPHLAGRCSCSPDERLSSGIGHPEIDFQGHRCRKCFPDVVHHWSPALMAAFQLAKPLDHATACTVLRWALNVQAKMAAAGWIAGSPVAITASDRGYPLDIAPLEGCFCVNISPYNGFDKRYRPIVRPEGTCTEGWLHVGAIDSPHNRFLACQRVILAIFLPKGTRVVLMNSRHEPSLPCALSLFLPIETPQSLDLAPKNFRASHSSFISGRVRFSSRALSQLVRFGHLYGADEVVFGHERWVMVVTGRRLHPSVCRYWPKGSGASLFVGFSLAKGRCFSFTPVSNGAYKMIDVLAQDLAFTDDEPPFILQGDGSYRELGVRDFDGPRRLYEAGEFGKVSRKRILVYTSAGTTGDVVPPQAIFRWLAVRGFHVIHLPTTTKEEGIAMLAAAERDDPKSYQSLWAAITVGIASVGFTTFAPYYFGGADIPISIEPPSWAIHPPDHGLGPILGNVFRYVYGMGPVMRIGSWGDVDSVPRSTNGKDFDVYRPGGKRDIPALYCPGNTSEVFTMPDHARLIEPGDHVSQMVRAREVYVTGAGTAQTAAACGAVVVAMSKLIDRRFRVPTDAGRGMVFGVSPERILSHLIVKGAGYDSLFSGLSIFGKIHCLRLWLSIHMTSLIFGSLLLCWLVVLSPRVLVWGPGLAGTFFYTLLQIHNPSLILILGTPFLVYSSQRLLVYFNSSWLSVLRHTLRWTLSSLESIIFYLLVTSFGYYWLWAVFLTAFFSWLGKFMLLSLISSLVSREEDYVWLAVRWFWVGPIPLAHTSYLRHDRKRIIEGSFSGPARLGVGYYKEERDVHRGELDKYHWFLSTALPWSSAQRARVPFATYQIWWNCQSMLLYMTRNSLYRLGWAFWFMVPAIVLTMAFASAAWIIAGLLSGIVLLNMSALAAMRNYELALSMVGIYEHLLRLLSIIFQNYGPFHAKALALCAAVMTAAGRPGLHEDLENFVRRHWEPHTEVGLQASRLSKVWAARHGVPFSLRAMESYLAYLGSTVVSSVTARSVRNPIDVESVMATGKCPADLYAEIQAVTAISIDDPEVVIDEGLVSTDNIPVVVAMLQVLSMTGASTFARDGLRCAAHLFETTWYSECPPSKLQESTEEYVDPEDDHAETVLKILSYLFFESKVEELKPPQDAFTPHEVTVYSEKIAELVDAGADMDDATEAVLTELAGYENSIAPEGAGKDLAALMLSDYMSAREKYRPTIEKIWDTYYKVRLDAERYNLVFMAPFEFFVSLVQRVGGDLTTIASMIASPLFDLFAGCETNSPERLTFGLCLSSILDLIDPRHRTSLKPAWALLIEKPIYRLRKSDAMFATFATTSYKRPANYEAWAAKMIDLMRGTPGVDVSKLTASPPTRMVFTPRSTFGIKQHEDMMTYFHARIIETDRERRALEQAIRVGAPESIDMVWASSPAAGVKSLSRYLVDRPEPSAYRKSKIIEAADSLFDDFPEMYDSPRGMTIGGVIAATEWRYSAGLPYLPYIKKRSQIKNSAWIHAFKASAEKIIASGEWPGMAFHGFPKSQLMAMDKIIGGKKIRFITAQDRNTAAAYNALGMEVNKRPPPARALVLPSFRRSEGGMQEVYKALREHPNLFTGDASDFDSTACSELVIEGPVRLWSRGVEGDWGEKATTSFMRAFYESLADGTIISLIDGTEFRKTGGGGTGSAPTTPNNRDWVRIVFRASWSMVTGRPCREFSSCVTLANASDDVVFSCDEETKEVIEDIKATMLAEFGVSFGFRHQLNMDGILHLDETEPDMRMYERVGIPANPVPIRHNRARLFQMRSEYRSDRMSSNWLVAYDHIATRDIGHIYLTAHDPESYALVAESWEDAFVAFSLLFVKQVEIERALDENGVLMGSTVMVKDASPSKSLLLRARKMCPDNPDGWIKAQMIFYKRWARAHKCPSYTEVFSLWVKPPEGESAVSRRYRHLPLPPFVSPIIDVVRNGIARADSTLAFIPKSLIKIGGEADKYTLLTPFTKSEFIVESFIWLKYLERHHRRPTMSELVAKCRMSPFGSCVDPKAFMLWVYSPEGDQIMNPTQRSKDSVATALVLSLIIYTVADIVLIWMTSFRVIGTLIILLFFFTQRIDFFYSLVSLGFWVGEGDVNLAVSNLTARDPYLILKLVSLLIVQAFYIKDWCAIPFMWQFTVTLSWPSKALLAIAQVKTLIPSSTQKALVDALDGSKRSLPDTWLHEAAAVVGNQDLSSAILLTGGVGLGKSTSFVATILDSHSVRRVFLVLPTNALVLDMTNDFVDPGYQSRHMAGEKLDSLANRGQISLTYGHLLRLLTQSEKEERLMPDPTDVFVLDEAGEGSLEQMLVYAALFGDNDRLRSKVVAMTATPQGPLCEALSGRVLHKAFTAARQQFTREVIRTDERDFSNLLQLAINEDSEALRRSLSVVLSLDEAARVERSMASIGYVGGVMSSELPEVPRGFISATTIVDVGMNITPPPNVLIDCSQMIVRYPSDIACQHADGHTEPARSRLATRGRFYRSLSAWTSPQVEMQRHGRVGRVANGKIFCLRKSGTGEQAGAHISTYLFLSIEPKLMGVLSRTIRMFPVLRVFHDQLPAPWCYVAVSRDLVTGTPLLNGDYGDIRLAYLLTVIYEGFVPARNAVIDGSWARNESVTAILASYPGTLRPPTKDHIRPEVIALAGVALQHDVSARYGKFLIWDGPQATFRFI
jgi:hypothetical protein